MKQLLLFILLCSMQNLFAQQFGSPVTEENAISVSKVDQNMVGEANLKLKGTIEAACQVKGCWMTMNLPDDRIMRVTFKDYGFFVPIDCSGKTAVIEGQLSEQIIPVAELKHLAQDAGKSDAEIEEITQPATELVFVANGVLLLEE